MPTASDELQVQCEQFIAFKRAAGVRYVKEAAILRRFLVFASDYLTDAFELPKDAVLAWNCRNGDEKPNNRRIRVNSVRSFAIYLNSKGIPAYISEKIRFGKSSFVPHIFSNAELARLFSAADKHPSSNTSPNRCQVMPMLLRTMYSSGMRVSEATKLRVCDVDLSAGLITVLDTKFNKDRLIPVHSVLLEQLQRYAGLTLPVSDKHAPFFPAPEGRFYNPSTVYGAFRNFLWDAGISHGGKGRGPRLHDLRHTFAVHCLRKWVMAGDDLLVALPYLSAYMGHNDLRYSQIYLRLTAEMYPDIVAKTERMFDVIPDWEGSYETD